jgi:hypothetical protein
MSLRDGEWGKWGPPLVPALSPPLLSTHSLTLEARFQLRALVCSYEKGQFQSCKHLTRMLSWWPESVAVKMLWAT